MPMRILTASLDGALVLTLIPQRASRASAIQPLLPLSLAQQRVRAKQQFVLCIVSALACQFRSRAVLELENLAGLSRLTAFCVCKPTFVGASLSPES